MEVCFGKQGTFQLLLVRFFQSILFLAGIYYLFVNSQFKRGSAVLRGRLHYHKNQKLEQFSFGTAQYTPYWKRAHHAPSARCFCRTVHPRNRRRPRGCFEVSWVSGRREEMGSDVIGEYFAVVDTEAIALARKNFNKFFQTLRAPLKSKP